MVRKKESPASGGGTLERDDCVISPPPIAKFPEREGAESSCLGQRN